MRHINKKNPDELYSKSYTTSNTKSDRKAQGQKMAAILYDNPKITEENIQQSSNKYLLPPAAMHYYFSINKLMQKEYPNLEKNTYILILYSYASLYSAITNDNYGIKDDCGSLNRIVTSTIGEGKFFNHTENLLDHLNTVLLYKDLVSYIMCYVNTKNKNRGPETYITQVDNSLHHNHILFANTKNHKIHEDIFTALQQVKNQKQLREYNEYYRLRTFKVENIEWIKENLGNLRKLILTISNDYLRSQQSKGRSQGNNDKIFQISENIFQISDDYINTNHKTSKRRSEVNNNTQEDLQKKVKKADPISNSQERSQNDNVNSNTQILNRIISNDSSIALSNQNQSATMSSNSIISTNNSTNLNPIVLNSENKNTVLNSENKNTVKDSRDQNFDYEVQSSKSGNSIISTNNSTNLNPIVLNSENKNTIKDSRDQNFDYEVQSSKSGNSIIQQEEQKIKSIFLKIYESYKTSDRSVTKNEFINQYCENHKFTQEVTDAVKKYCKTISTKSDIINNLSELKKSKRNISPKKLFSEELLSINYIISVYMQYKRSNEDVKRALSRSFENNQIEQIMSALNTTFTNIGEKNIDCFDPEEFEALAQSFFSNFKLYHLKDLKFSDIINTQQNNQHHLG